MYEEEIISLDEDVSSSPLYSEDLAPVPKGKRTWTTFDLAAIWVGMAVCIPTYILASYMIKSGMSWYAALIIIALANLIITIPMILNGHAGVKYGIPFPVLGRASFGTKGIHIPAIVRAIVACGWFGVQTWIGGLAIYAIWNAVTGSEGSAGLDLGKFIGFGIFWMINMHFIWHGTESIKWLEKYSAPILVFMGIALIGWGAYEAGGFGTVLEKGAQMQTPTAVIKQEGEQFLLYLSPLRTKDGRTKAESFDVFIDDSKSNKMTVSPQMAPIDLKLLFPNSKISAESKVAVQFSLDGDDKTIKSSIVSASIEGKEGSGQSIMSYMIWLTAMVGFWATMSLSIADITRYASTQKAQIKGQLIGLPGTMILYSFVGVFVTFAATLNFSDILVSDDAPWDPVSLLSKFDSPVVVVISQIFMIIATLSTNIAANVIAPANAFSNLLPKQISFRSGGIITAVIGIVICPWWLLNEISGILIFISGLLGPVLGILVCDYFLIRKKKLELAELYKVDGAYSYSSGFNMKAMISLIVGVLLALAGYWIPSIGFLYSLSWFTGFIISFSLYYLLMKKL
jgi:cytosine/uracil/thiamine/allantoin permease